MAAIDYIDKFIFVLILSVTKCSANDILGCGGFVKSHVSLDFSKIEIGLYTKGGSLKEKTECAPTNGYYFLPLYEKGEYVLKVHPPAGWSFEPSIVDLTIDGETDACYTGQDINFAFNGFGITGRVITAGQKQGPSGISIQLVNDKGEVRNTATTVGGDFHFTPVIPGKYTVKASHPRWKLEPSQAVVQVKEGNTALPFGVLAVKGYDVTGSVTSFGSPISGLFVLLYSKEESPKFRVEGCNTALLQGVPDSPICHSVTDTSGEFSFGLVPAGEYKLLALSTPPGQVAVSYNVKPETVAFTVKHDSIYIKNAFEVTGFTVVGSVISAVGGAGVSGARVVVDGKPIGNTDGAGKFTLPSLHPGVYNIGVQHEQCEFDEVQLTVSAAGPRSPVAVRPARWRVCGAVAPPVPVAPAPAAAHPAPPAPRTLTLTPATGQAAPITVTPDDAGKWCTFVPSGVYTAKVDVTEQEQRDGLQFYPLTQKVSVGNAPVEGITFSQLKGTLSGTIECLEEWACASLQVTLRPLSADGGYVGQPLTTVALNGEYTFEEVAAGSVEVSVEGGRLCWAEARHNVAVTQAHAAVPAFQHTGYVLRLHSTHDVEVEYSSASSRGVVFAARGASVQCVPTAAPHTLTPRGCHRFSPAHAQVDTSAPHPTTVYLVAVAHAVAIRVTAPEPAQDLTLRVSTDGEGVREVGPLAPLQGPGGGYVFEHTLYMAEGEVAVVSAQSSSLLFHPPAPQQVIGRASCQLAALTVRARSALTLAGRLVPPVGDVTVTVTVTGAQHDNDETLTRVTTEDGTYRFGPLDASKAYTITAEKESYVFSAPDENGDIIAHKLAEITVELLDDADATPLQGALVSVSGGTYRRNVASGADGRLRFGSLSPAQYYVKPNMKEYKFSPPHKIVDVQEGLTHRLSLRGVRVAWSCFGQLVSLGGAGWAGATLQATPSPSSAHPACVAEEATTDPNGAFRIRGLLPDCVYTIHLKDSNTPELSGLKLVKAPAALEVTNKKDLNGVRVIAARALAATDGGAVVRALSLSLYRTLRLSLALEAAPHSPIFSTKLDPAGFTESMNPGLMYVLPRLPADNKTYVLQLESTLSKATHMYEEVVHYFTSDGHYKHFYIEFAPKVKSSEQELRQSSLLVIPLLAVVALGYRYRLRLAGAVADAVAAAGAGAGAGRAARSPRPPRPDLLDRASIEHIVSAVNAAGKKVPKKKAL